MHSHSQVPIIPAGNAQPNQVIPKARQSRANCDYTSAPTGGHTKYEGIGQVGFIRDMLSVSNEVTIRPDDLHSKTVVGVGEVFAANDVNHKDKVHKTGPSSNKSYKAIKKIHRTKIHAGGPRNNECSTGNKEGRLGNSSKRTSRKSYAGVKAIHGAEVHQIGGPGDNKCTGKPSHTAMKKIQITGGPSNTARTAMKKIDESGNITQEMKFDI